VATCWECETETAWPMTVRLRLTDGASSLLVLCPVCHRKLARELTDDEVSFHTTQPPRGEQGQGDEE